MSVTLRSIPATRLQLAANCCCPSRLSEHVSNLSPLFTVPPAALLPRRVQSSESDWVHAYTLDMMCGASYYDRSGHPLRHTHTICTSARHTHPHSQIAPGRSGQATCYVNNLEDETWGYDDDCISSACDAQSRRRLSTSENKTRSFGDAALNHERPATRKVSKLATTTSAAT